MSEAPYTDTRREAEAVLLKCLLTVLGLGFAAMLAIAIIRG